MNLNGHVDVPKVSAMMGMKFRGVFSRAVPSSLESIGQSSQRTVRQCMHLTTHVILHSNASVTFSSDPGFSRNSLEYSVSVFPDDQRLPSNLQGRKLSMIFLGLLENRKKSFRGSSELESDRDYFSTSMGQKDDQNFISPTVHLCVWVL